MHKYIHSGTNTLYNPACINIRNTCRVSCEQIQLNNHRSPYVEHHMSFMSGVPSGVRFFTEYINPLKCSRKMLRWASTVIADMIDTTEGKKSYLMVQFLSARVYFEPQYALYLYYFIWVSIAEQLHPSITSPSATQSVGCSGVKYATTGLYSSGDVLFTVTNHTSLFGNPADWGWTLLVPEWMHINAPKKGP